jgi:hypothetical protein
MQAIMTRGVPISPAVRKKIKYALRKGVLTPEAIAKLHNTSAPSVRLIKSKIAKRLSIKHKKNKGNKKFG